MQCGGQSIGLDTVYICEEPRSTSDRCAGHRAGSTGCVLEVVIVASVAEDMLLDGPCDILGGGSVSPLVTNFSIDPVMTRNPSYKQIIEICFGFNGKLHNEINFDYEIFYFNTY